MSIDCHDAIARLQGVGGGSSRNDVLHRDEAGSAIVLEARSEPLIEFRGDYALPPRRREQRLTPTLGVLEPTVHHVSRQPALN